MNRLMTVPLAGLLALAVAAPVAAGPNVGNVSGSVTMAEGSWATFDGETGTYVSGFVAVSQEQESSQANAQYSENSKGWHQCTGADTPDNPDDDTFGVIATSLWGYGVATLSIGGNNSSASASGTLTMVRERFDECTFEWTYEELSDRAVTLNLTATSSTIRSSDRSNFHVPGEFNSHSSYKSVYRLAEGTFVGPDGSQSVSGQIGKVSWMQHSNG